MTSSKFAPSEDTKELPHRRKERLPKGMSPSRSTSPLTPANFFFFCLREIGSQIQVRPITRPPIPSPYTGADQPKVIYISARSSFIGVVKRVGNAFKKTHKQNMAKIKLIDGKGTDKQKLESLAGAATTAVEAEIPQAVFLKATNMAINKALSIALYLKEQGDLLVQLRTDTVAVVDDIVYAAVPKDVAESEDKVKGEEEEPKSRVRYLSVLEVAITLKP